MRAGGADIAIEKARELVSNRLLWPLVRDFLWDFAPQVHPSWVEDLFSRRDAEAQGGKVPFEGLGDAASLREAKSPRVKRYILEALNVEPCFHSFPKEDGSRLLLLEGATLESVAKWLGALACADALRRVTDGATVRGLKAALHGVYPEVLGYTMYFASLEGEKVGRWEGEKVGSLEVEKVGFGLVLQGLSALSAPLIQRLKLKLPKRMTDSEPLNFETSHLPTSSPSHLPTLQTSIFKLLKLKFPEAYKLCCS